MANTLVQFRVEESIRENAVKVCERIGLDIPTYMRICLSRLIMENGVPFPMKFDKVENNKGYQAMVLASQIASESGISDMSLDEINAEISEARK
ncbi:MAG: type II toxin-antitoxin system RelB/DinJ family antitoxin [Veillonellaceae bacterium]|nr:type II toxin-antitoxin system RelB/DinJ family antitoxin [Veillonellaceae bacterium]